MKAIVEEQEKPVAAQPVSQPQRTQSAVWGASAQPKPRAIDTPSKSKEYPSCLDLAAEFLARG